MDDFTGAASSALRPDEIRELVAGVRQWHHRMHFPHGISSPGAYNPGDLFRRLGLTDLRGKRVLDIGTRDGFFAFECEKLGAQVVAIDSVAVERTGFAAARKILGSTVDYQVANVYDMTPERFGEFDVVLFLGVLYHLRHPLLALDRLRALCRGMIFVETWTCDAGLMLGFEHAKPIVELAPELAGIPFAQFLPRGRFHPDWTNKWVPNIACLQALLEDAQFAPQEIQAWGSRTLVRAIAVEGKDARVRREQDSGAG